MTGRGEGHEPRIAQCLKQPGSRLTGSPPYHAPRVAPHGDHDATPARNVPGFPVQRRLNTTGGGLNRPPPEPSAGSKAARERAARQCAIRERRDGAGVVLWSHRGRRAGVGWRDVDDVRADVMRVPDPSCGACGAFADTSPPQSPKQPAIGRSLTAPPAQFASSELLLVGPRCPKFRGSIGSRHARAPESHASTEGNLTARRRATRGPARPGRADRPSGRGFEGRGRSPTLYIWPVCTRSRRQRQSPPGPPKDPVSGARRSPRFWRRHS